MAVILKTNNVGKKSYWVYVNCRDVHGKRIQLRRKGILTIREAQAIEFELKRQLANQKDESKSYIWEEWFDICLMKMKTEFKNSTIINYISKNKIWILPFWKEKDLNSITPTDVHEVVYNPQFDASWYTRKTTLKIIKRIFTLAVEEGLLQRNPALQVKVVVPQARQAVLNKTEVEILLREAKQVNHRFYEIWAVAILTGMRSGELYAMKWADVDLEGGKIHVVRSWSSINGFGETKTAKNRVVPISSELRTLLLHLRQKNNASEFVLPHPQEWKKGYQAQVIRDFCTGLGITSVKFHDLRATFITQLLNNGVSLAIVMAIVGHGQIKTTQAYLRLAGLDLKGATEKLGRVLPAEPDNKVIQLGIMK